MKTAHAGILISPLILFSLGLNQEQEKSQSKKESETVLPKPKKPKDAISVVHRYHEAILLIKVEGKTQEAASILKDILDELRPNSHERRTALKIIKKVSQSQSRVREKTTIQQSIQLNLSVGGIAPQNITPKNTESLFPIKPKTKKAFDKDKLFASHYGGEKKEVFCKGVGLVKLTAKQNDGTETSAVLVGGSWGPDKSYIQSKGGQWEYLLEQHVPFKENCTADNCRKVVKKRIQWHIQPNHHTHHTSLTYEERHSQDLGDDVTTVPNQLETPLQYSKAALSLTELSMPELSKGLKPELAEKHMPYWGRVVRYLSHRKPQKTDKVPMEPWGMHTLLQLYHWGLPKTATPHFINRLYVTVNGPKLQYLLRRRAPNNKIHEIKSFKLDEGDLKGTTFANCIEIHTDVTVRKNH